MVEANYMAREEAVGGHVIYSGGKAACASGHGNDSESIGHTSGTNDAVCLTLTQKKRIHSCHHTSLSVRTRNFRGAATNGEVSRGWIRNIKVT
jgi:hypothetical protein